VHGRVFLLGVMSGSHFSSCRRKTRPSSQAPTRVTNVMTRNS
jgi:hypothetical protein